MALLQEWQKVAYNEKADKGQLQKFWNAYFLLEKGRCTAPAGFSLNAQVKAEKLVSVQNAPPKSRLKTILRYSVG